MLAHLVNAQDAQTLEGLGSHTCQLSMHHYSVSQRITTHLLKADGPESIRTETWQPDAVDDAGRACQARHTSNEQKSGVDQTPAKEEGPSARPSGFPWFGGQPYSRPALVTPPMGSGIFSRNSATGIIG